MHEMNDYHATAKIQQGRLKSAMANMGILTAAELARRSGVSQKTIGDLLNFKASPKTRSGRWREVTIRICSAVGSEPSEVFPEHLDHEVTTNVIERFMDHAQLTSGYTAQLHPGQECEIKDMSDRIDAVLSTLTDKEQGVIRARMWDGKTYTDIAESMCISASRAIQIEAKAIRKLRHPARVRQLT